MHDELVANGASFLYRPSTATLPASFVYELPADGDRLRCRRVIAAAKADTMLWAALVRIIGAHWNGAA